MTRAAAKRQRMIALASGTLERFPQVLKRASLALLISRLGDAVRFDIAVPVRLPTRIFTPGTIRYSVFYKHPQSEY
jgi:hypothetical protein